ncbi:hypothetical protein [Ralstonia sp.]|uniref:helix-turn-helix transcriptional regulator n=1 Tax=Ralstonia sp. TaxID=54061 RepID=UPI0031E3C695
MRHPASKKGAKMGFDFASDDVLLDIDAVCKKLSISRSTLERLRRPRELSQFEKAAALVGKGDDFSGMPPFPEPTVMLGRSPRWSTKVLNAWINGPRKLF